MSKENKKENLSTLYVDVLTKKGLEKLVLTGEITEVCDSEEVLKAMREAKEKDGMIYLYKRKKEIKAFCIFTVEEREIPLGAALVDRKQVMDDAFKDDKNRTRDTQEGAETVNKNCYVLKAFRVAPSYADRTEEFKKLFTKVLRDHMIEGNDEIPAFFWEDELVMSNQVISGGKMVSAASLGACIGGLIGIVLAMLCRNSIHYLGIYLLWGVVLGGSLCGGTTTMKMKLAREK